MWRRILAFHASKNKFLMNNKRVIWYAIPMINMILGLFCVGSCVFVCKCANACVLVWMYVFFCVCSYGLCVYVWGCVCVYVYVRVCVLFVMTEHNWLYKAMYNLVLHKLFVRELIGLWEENTNHWSIVCFVRGVLASTLPDQQKVYRYGSFR